MLLDSLLRNLNNHPLFPLAEKDFRFQGITVAWKKLFCRDIRSCDKQLRRKIVEFRGLMFGENISTRDPTPLDISKAVCGFGEESIVNASHRAIGRLYSIWYPFGSRFTTQFGEERRIVLMGAQYPSIFSYESFKMSAGRPTVSPPANDSWVP